MDNPKIENPLNPDDWIKFGWAWTMKNPVIALIAVLHVIVQMLLLIGLLRTLDVRVAWLSASFIVGVVLLAHGVFDVVWLHILQRAFSGKISNLNGTIGGLQGQLKDAATQGSAVADLSRRLLSDDAARADIWRNAIFDYGKQRADIMKLIASVDQRMGEQDRTTQIMQRELEEAKRLLVAACTPPKALPKPAGPGSAQE